MVSSIDKEQQEAKRGGKDVGDEGDADDMDVEMTDAVVVRSASRATTLSELSLLKKN